MLIAESPGLDFLNSVAGGGGDKVEWLGDGTGLVAWMCQSELLPRDVADRLGSAGAAELDVVAGEARALREWFRGFVTEHAGQGLARVAAAELAPLNAVLAAGIGHKAVAATPDGLNWEWCRDWQSPAALLQPLAEAIGRTIVEADFTHVRACEGSGCTLLFHDTTKNRRRRWCSMAVCGNRAKQALYRARHAG